MTVIEKLWESCSVHLFYAQLNFFITVSVKMIYNLKMGSESEILAVFT